jgi:polar amino acid transport system substrate-binding protein
VADAVAANTARRRVIPTRYRSGEVVIVAELYPGRSDANQYAVTVRTVGKKPNPRRVLLVGALFAIGALLGFGCGNDDAAGSGFSPQRAGVFTVATASLPAPGFWNGTDAAGGGFEAELAGALAGRFGLETVDVVQVPFADIASGELSDADLALTQMTPTDERERSVDFTTPYLTAPPGVLVRAGVTARDLEDLKNLRWVTIEVSTLTSVVNEQIQPDDSPLVVSDRAAALTALRSGRADAVLLDLPVAQGIAGTSGGRLTVVAQLPRGEGLAAVLPQSAKNREVVDSAIRALTADGTIKDLADKNLGSAGGIRLIRTGGE